MGALPVVASGSPEPEAACFDYDQLGPGVADRVRAATDEIRALGKICHEA